MSLLPFIAESPMPEGFMGWLIAGLLALIGLYREAQKLGGKADNVSVGPQPLKVAAQEKFVEKASFNMHLDLDRAEHEKDREEYRAEHEKIWTAIENFRSDNSRKIETLIGKVDATAAVMARIGDEVRDAARTARDAATSASVAINEARHKKS
jgi:hypothetical protein